jgi:hypothetical protein
VEQEVEEWWILVILLELMELQTQEEVLEVLDYSEWCWRRCCKWWKWCCYTSYGRRNYSGTTTGSPTVTTVDGTDTVLTFTGSGKLHSIGDLYGTFCKIRKRKHS